MSKEHLGANTYLSDRCSILHGDDGCRWDVVVLQKFGQHMVPRLHD